MYFELDKGEISRGRLAVDLQLKRSLSGFDYLTWDIQPALLAGEAPHLLPLETKPP